MQRVIKHGVKINSSGISAQKAAKRVGDACYSYCACKLTGLRSAFPSVQDQIAAQLQPRRMTDWLRSRRGRATELMCSRQWLVLPFEAVRTAGSFCTTPQNVRASVGGTKLKDTDVFSYILKNYKQDLRPRPRDAYARDTISLKSAGFMYQDIRNSSAQRNHGLPNGRGVHVRGSSLKAMPAYSIILSVDNIKITRGINQVHRILENKSIGDEIVFCGMKHSTENNRSVWKSEFTARTQVRAPHVKIPAKSQTVRRTPAKRQPTYIERKRAAKRARLKKAREKFEEEGKEMLKLVLGQWKGRYGCSNETTEVTVLITGRTVLQLNATVKIQPLPGQPASSVGEMYLRGHFYSKSSSLSFLLKNRPKQKDKHLGTSMSGKLNDGGKKLSLRIASRSPCNRFVVERG